MGWKGESRRHSLSRKGIKTNLPDGRRFDVSNYVARGFGSWIGVTTLMDYLEENSIDIVDTNEEGIFIQNQKEGNSEIAHIDIYEGMKYDNYKWIIDWEKSPEVKREDVKDAFAIITDDWIKEFNKFEKGAN